MGRVSTSYRRKWEGPNSPLSFSGVRRATTIRDGNDGDDFGTGAGPSSRRKIISFFLTLSRYRFQVAELPRLQEKRISPVRVSQFPTLSCSSRGDGGRCRKSSRGCFFFFCLFFFFCFCFFSLGGGFCFGVLGFFFVFVHPMAIRARVR